MRTGSNLVRSIVFWAGLLVMLFIVWAAVYSQYRAATWVYRPSPESRITIKSVAARISIGNARLTRG
jgi:hypothetical protein